MSEHEIKRILEIIETSCRGRKQAISARVLARQAEVDERTARDLVAELVVVHKKPIGSHPACGFFWIVDREDKDLASRNLRSRGVKILQRLAAINKTDVKEEAVQLTLFPKS